MIDVMNQCGVDYVCLGNHESNISWDDLKLRAKESKFTWLNTNMPDVVLPEGNINEGIELNDIKYKSLYIDIKLIS
jgi:2',3'-cyclic-nucleotide 2'-phosphodiesterase (5'-nucleotidase family)